MVFHRCCYWRGMVTLGLLGERMSLPQNIPPLNPDRLPHTPIVSTDTGQIGAMGKDIARAWLHVRDALKRTSARKLSVRIGISRRSLQRFLKYGMVGKESLAKLADWGRTHRIRKPRNRKDKRIFPCPGHWIADTI